MSETTTETSTEEAAAETSGDSTETSATEATTTEGESALGDAGKKALDAMKAKWKDADKLAKDNAAALAAIQAKLDGKEAEFTAAQEAQRVKDEAIAAANERILKAEIRAAASGKVNPDLISDLPVLMDLSALEVGADGEVDQTAIAAAISDLIARKPSLAAQGGQRFQGTADGGARNEATKPSQLTQADMARMSPEQIAKAHDDGRFDDLLKPH